MPACTFCCRPPTRTMKNSSRLDSKMARNLRRSSSGTCGSCASSRTRRLNSSQLSSRLMYSDGSVQAGAPGGAIPNLLERSRHYNHPEERTAALSTVQGIASRRRRSSPSDSHRTDHARMDPGGTDARLRPRSSAGRWRCCPSAPPSRTTCTCPTAPTTSRSRSLGRRACERAYDAGARVAAAADHPLRRQHQPPARFPAAWRAA